MNDYDKNFGNAKGKFTMANLTTIKNLKIPVPPIAEQEKLVAKIEKLEQTIAVQQTKIDSAGERKKEIMQKYL
jgi:type I restriction enzyme M protein